MLINIVIGKRSDKEGNVHVREARVFVKTCGTILDVTRSTPTQQPTIPWSRLLRQRPRQCCTLQLTQQDWGNYQELSCSLSIDCFGLVLLTDGVR